MSRQPSGARRLSGIRILVVEDDSDSLGALVTLLEHNGAEAQGASCADAWRTAFGRFRPDVLISDLSMPGEDGFTFLASVRALSTQDGGETPAIAFSAMSPTDAQERARSAGFQAFLRKPHDVLLLIPMVLHLLSTSLGVVLFVDGEHGEHVLALRNAGYRVEVSTTALEALGQGWSLHPDVLIVPLVMPGMPGGELADRIGEDPARVHSLAVVILVATEGDAAERPRKVSAGATFCQLPCSPSALVELVGNQIAARRRIGG